MDDSKTKENIKLMDTPESEFEFLKEYFTSDNKIIEFLCGISGFDFNEYYKNKEIYGDKNKDKVEAILNLANKLNNQVNGEKNRTPENLPAILNTLQLVGLNLFYFGITNKDGVYIGLEDPYLELDELENDINYNEIKENYDKYNHHVMIDFNNLRVGNIDEILDSEKGKVSFNSIEIEHIMNLKNNSGTILPNCILSSAFANRGKGQKSTNPLINYLDNKDNYNYTRLYTLANYILSGYELLFEGYDAQANLDNYIFNNYYPKIENYDGFQKTLSNEIMFVKNIIKELNTKNSGSHNEDLITGLHSIEKNYLSNWEKVDAIQNAVSKWFEENLPSEDRIYETIDYTQKVDYIKLLNIIDPNKGKSLDEIKSIVFNKLHELQDCLNSNGYSFYDYFNSLKEFNESDLLYINNPKEEQISEFINNVKLGNDSKELIFIEMIRHVKDEYELAELLMNESPIPFTTYTEDGQIAKIYDVPVGYYYSKHPKLKEKVIKLIEEDIELRDKLDNYYVNTHSGQLTEEGKLRRKEIYLEMLRHTKNLDEVEKLLRSDSNVHFTTYTNEGQIDKIYNALVGNYFAHHSELREEINADIELRDKLDDYYMNTKSGQKSLEGRTRRKEIFLEMLRHAKNEYEFGKLLMKNKTMGNSSIKFTTYTKDGQIDKRYDEVGDYFKVHPKLKEDINKDPYLKEMFDKYLMNTLSGQQSEEGIKLHKKIYLDMLRHAKDEYELAKIIKASSKVRFTTYTEDGQIDKRYGEVGAYINNSLTIKKEIEREIESDSELREKLDNYYINTLSGQNSTKGKKYKLNLFIEMIRHTQDDDEVYNILNQKSQLKFKRYQTNLNNELIEIKEYKSTTGKYSYDNLKDKVIPNLIFSEEYADQKYNIVRIRILNYLNNIRIKKHKPTFESLGEYLLSLDRTIQRNKGLKNWSAELDRTKQQLIDENQMYDDMLSVQDVKPIFPMKGR